MHPASVLTCFRAYVLPQREGCALSLRQQDELNKIVKQELSVDKAEELTKAYTKEAQINSKDYYNRMLEQVKKGLIIIKKRGLIQYTYKPLGVSPRIIPEGYSMTINGVKRLVRDYTYLCVSS
nr:putative phage/plasmid DNA primase [Oedogonium sp. BN3]